MSIESDILEVRIPVFITVRYSKADGCFYSSSDFIDIVRDGETPGEAVNMFCEALEIMVESSLRLGTFKQLMEEGGYVCDEVEIGEKGRIISCRLPRPVTFDTTLLKSEFDSLTFEEYTYNAAEGNLKPCPV